MSLTEMGIKEFGQSWKSTHGIKGLFGQQKIITQFPSLNFHHSSLITHHSFFHTHLATSLLFSSLNFFTLFIGPTPVSWYSVFFFFFFLVPNSPRLIF